MGVSASSRVRGIGLFQPLAMFQILHWIPLSGSFAAQPGTAGTESRINSHPGGGPSGVHDHHRICATGGSFLHRGVALV